jgi:hypothetical protein
MQTDFLMLIAGHLHGFTSYKQVVRDRWCHLKDKTQHLQNLKSLNVGEPPKKTYKQSKKKENSTNKGQGCFLFVCLFYCQESNNIVELEVCLKQ